MIDRSSPTVAHDLSAILSSRRGDTGRPDFVRELLGRHLRNLRLSRQLSRADAAGHISGSESKITRIERGQIRAKPEDVEHLLHLYHVTDDGDRRSILELTARLVERQWWQDSSTALPSWFCSYLILESIAVHIRTYEVRFIPGLLQTRAYADAVVRLAHVEEATTRQRVDVRMRRQSMASDQQTILWAVIDESALYAVVGNPQVMLQQIEVLLQQARKRRITIQVLPTGAKASAVGGTSFSILRLPIKTWSDVVYLEQINSALYLADPDNSDGYLIAMERLGIEARTPAASLDILENARCHWHRETKGF